MFEELFSKIESNADAIDIIGQFPEKEFNWMTGAGLLEIVLTGNAADFSQGHYHTLLKLLKDVGRANLSVGRIYEGHVNALQLIHHFAGCSQKQRWLNDLQLRKHLFGVWNTQDNEGVEISRLENGKYLLSGCKTFCSGAHWINRPVVTGELKNGVNKGWQMFVLPVENVPPLREDKTYWNPMGMKASASFKMDFTGIEIAEEDLLGQPGDYYKEPNFNGGAVRFAAVHLGGAEAVLTATHRFLKDINRTNSDFQKARIAEMGMLVESGNHWIKSAAEKMKKNAAGDLDDATNTAYAGMVRTAIEQICTRVLQLSGVCVGARGLMKPHPLERLHRDLNFYLRQPAPDAVILNIGSHIFSKENIGDAWE